MCTEGSDVWLFNADPEQIKQTQLTLHHLLMLISNEGGSKDTGLRSLGWCGCLWLEAGGVTAHDQGPSAGGKKGTSPCV